MDEERDQRVIILIASWSRSHHGEQIPILMSNQSRPQSLRYFCPARRCTKGSRPLGGLRALFPDFGGGAGKGPGIGRSIRYFDWLIDLGNSCKKMAK